MPGLKIGEGIISLGYSKVTDEGRMLYDVKIDLPDSEWDVNDMKSGCQGGNLQEGFASLLCFLGAAAESYRYRGCDWDLVSQDDNAAMFPRSVVEWAYQHSDEISILEQEVNEIGLIEE